MNISQGITFTMHYADQTVSNAYFTDHPADVDVIADFVARASLAENVETLTMSATTADFAQQIAWAGGPYTEYSEALADAYEDGGHAAVAELEAPRKVRVNHHRKAREQAFQDGYQAALRDAADPTAWIADNLHDEAARDFR